MKVTHLVVFLPPALGTYVLFRHRTKMSSSLSSADDISMQDGPHTLRGWFRGTPFRRSLQGGLKGLGAKEGKRDEGLKVEGGFTFGRLQGGFKGA